MISTTLPLYPILTQKMVDTIGLQFGKFTFSSSAQGIDPCSNDASWPGPVTFGQQGIWNAESHDLSLEVSVSFNPVFFFGAMGIACENSILGVALEWTSHESNQRGNSNLVSFKREGGKVHAIFTLPFAPNQVRGKVIIAVCLYIVSPDNNPKQSERHLANQAGIYLGSVSNQCVLLFDGDAALFPVIEFNDQDAPLWRIMYDSADPCSDSFSINYVCLEVNNAHVDFPAFKGDIENQRSTPLARQVIASWLTLFLLIFKEENRLIFDKLKNNESDIDYAPGSITEFVSYLLKTFHINTENVQNLSETISKLVAGKLIAQGEIS